MLRGAFLTNILQEIFILFHRFGFINSCVEKKKLKMKRKHRTVLLASLYLNSKVNYFHINGNKFGFFSSTSQIPKYFFVQVQIFSVNGILVRFFSDMCSWLKNTSRVPSYVHILKKKRNFFLRNLGIVFETFLELNYD